jgi:hypothetical protein
MLLRRFHGAVAIVLLASACGMHRHGGNGDRGSEPGCSRPEEQPVVLLTIATPYTGDHGAKVFSWRGRAVSLDDLVDVATYEIGRRSKAVIRLTGDAGATWIEPLMRAMSEGGVQQVRIEGVRGQ